MSDVRRIRLARRYDEPSPDEGLREHLRELAATRTLTLLTSAKAVELSHARILATRLSAETEA